jgi:hypothetical protein
MTFATAGDHPSAGFQRFFAIRRVRQARGSTGHMIVTISEGNDNNDV